MQGKLFTGRIQIKVLTTLPLCFFNFWFRRTKFQNLKSSLGDSCFHINQEMGVDNVPLVTWTLKVTLWQWRKTFYCNIWNIYVKNGTISASTSLFKWKHEFKWSLQILKFYSPETKIKETKMVIQSEPWFESYLCTRPLTCSYPFCLVELCANTEILLNSISLMIVLRENSINRNLSATQGLSCSCKRWTTSEEESCQSH